MNTHVITPIQLPEKRPSKLLLWHTFKGDRSLLRADNIGKIQPNIQQIYQTFKWPTLNNVVHAPVWNPAYGYGLVGYIPVNGANFPFPMSLGYILQVVEVNPEDVLPIDNGIYIYKRGTVVAEYPITKDVILQLFPLLRGGLLYAAGRCWSNEYNIIPAEMLQEGLSHLTNYNLYKAGLDWKYVTDDMRRNVLKQLSGKQLLFAQENWSGITEDTESYVFDHLDGELLVSAGSKFKTITTEQRKAAFSKLYEFSLVQACLDWDDIPDDMKIRVLHRISENLIVTLGTKLKCIPTDILIDALKKLSDVYLYHAGCSWPNIPSEVLDKEIERLNGSQLYYAIQDWAISDEAKERAKQRSTWQPLS